MRFDFVGRAVYNIDAAAIGLPSRDTRREMLVGVGDAAVMLFLEFVFFGVRSGIAAQPELLDELLALLVGAQRFERLRSSSRDDVDHVLIQPLLLGRFQFFPELGFLLLFLLLRHRLGDRRVFLRGWFGRCLRGLRLIWRLRLSGWGRLILSRVRKHRPSDQTANHAQREILQGPHVNQFTLLLGTAATAFWFPLLASASPCVRY